MLLRFFLLLGLPLLGTPLAAQSEGDLNHRFAVFAEANQTGNTEALLGCLDAELFNYIPRAAVEEQMTALRTDANMTVEYTNYTIEAIGQAVAESGVRYVPLDYHYQLSLTMRSDAFREPATFARVVRMLEKRYGADRVAAHPPTASVRVAVASRLYGIDRGRGWHFVELPDGGASLLDLLVPPGVLERLVAQ